MSAQPVPTSDAETEAIAARLANIAATVNALDEEAKTLKALLSDRLGYGEHPFTNGLAVTVRHPSRRFNLDRAWTMLTPEQQTVCTAPDPRKVKAQLPETLLDACMDPGTGRPVVVVK